MESKIDLSRLIQLRRQGKTHKACAEEFGVSESAIKKTLAKISKQNLLIPTKKDSIGDFNIDSMSQLQEINTTIVDNLRYCNLLILREDSKLKEFDVLEKTMSENPPESGVYKEAKEKLDKLWGANLKNILSIQMNTINVSAEIRKQIELQLKIAESLYNIQVMQEFQAEIIQTLKEADPVIAARVIHKLKERRTLRGLMRL